MPKKITNVKTTKTAVEIPREAARKARLVKNAEAKPDKTCKVAEEEKDDVIGVKVIDIAQAPDPRTINKKLSPIAEETKQEDEGPTIAELAKKKASRKFALNANDEDAFNLFIFRVLKEQCPDFSISKKAMRTMNSINAEKFSQLMSECRSLVVNGKKSTLSSKEVETACKLTIFGELGQNAVAEGR